MTDASRLQLGGAAILALALALMLAPFQPLPLPIELRWLAAYLLFIVLPGWLLVRLVLPAQPGVLLERAILALAAGYSLAVLLGLTLHTLFRPISPWQIAAGGALLVAGLAAAGWSRTGKRASADQPPKPMTYDLRPSSVWPVLLLLDRGRRSAAGRSRVERVPG